MSVAHKKAIKYEAKQNQNKTQHSEARQTKSIQTKTSAINKIYCERESVLSMSACMMFSITCPNFELPKTWKILRDLWVKAIVYVHRAYLLYDFDTL